MTIFPITFAPTFPVEFGGNTYRQLTFTRPIGMVEIIVAEPIEDSTDKMNAVYASLAGVPADVVSRLSVADQLRLAEAVVPILELAPAVQAVA